jgi:hypothetical protein
MERGLDREMNKGTDREVDKGLDRRKREMEGAKEGVIEGGIL